MPVKHTTDALLVQEIAKNHSVILKYFTEECGKTCEKLLKVFQQLSDDNAYKDIVFLLINADENPIAKKYILEKKQPLITIYHNGYLIVSITIGTKEEMINLLNMLKQPLGAKKITQ